MMTYPDSVRYLYALGNEIRTIKLGLDRIRSLLAGLGNPQRSYRCIHIAGTNGKGSVAAMMESALRTSGARTGLFTSPHLSQPTERIQVAGRPLSEELFVHAFHRVYEITTRPGGRPTLDEQPTYFETVTAMALLAFAELGVEWAVLETGLGGRLDATNVVEPALCVLTSIDYDHETYLGSSLQSIAAEKAGIIKAGVPVVLAPQRAGVVPLIRRLAAAAPAPLEEVSTRQAGQREVHRRGSRFKAVRGDEAIPIECPLAGEHQIDNALTAVAALRRVGVGAEAVQRGIRQTRWPGRLERVRESPEIILDGAHNPAGIRALANYLHRFYEPRRTRLIYGAMRDKSLDEIAGILSPLARTIVLTNASSHRALRPEAIRPLFSHPDVRLAGSPREAVEMMMREAAAGEAVLVTGSLLLVGEARELLVG